MIPSEYRLDAVVARLIERLEGTRPTYGPDADKALAAFREIATRHVEAAITEFRDNAVEGDPEAHATFLRHEVTETLIPRYTRMAVEMTRSESSGFGFGLVSGPLGVPLLTVAAALGLMMLVRLAGWWEAWPLIALDLSLPLWPSAVAMLYRRRYRQQLEALVADAARIQDNERGFMSEQDVRAARELGSDQERARPRPKEVERG
ncbi:MAG: hypothetical protein KC621_05650 [Myxococcales bacterium]|nr:hypothetical protein [Myxococcales bacterium]